MTSAAATFEGMMHSRAVPTTLARHLPVLLPKNSLLLLARVEDGSHEWICVTHRDRITSEQLAAVHFRLQIQV